MLGVKRLEEEIARTKDPLVQKQLQELLDKRRKQEKQIVTWLAILIIIWLIGSTARRSVDAYYDRKETQMKIEHIQWQREMLDR